ncbi:putative reverse transcriptase domain-containing protein [Tanacetum coccineum]|uniref:Reverse transcriptase domain-containing protein n=1 Tax=Tanacetum coccineum TaxID=301880 RepID=A0ABQ5F644_9ASTR
MNLSHYCDASEEGLGRCVNAKRKVVFVLKIWRHYMYGTKCTLFTDHKSLQHILNQKELNMRHVVEWLDLPNKSGMLRLNNKTRENIKERKNDLEECWLKNAKNPEGVLGLKCWRPLTMEPRSMAELDYPVMAIYVKKL